MKARQARVPLSSGSRFYRLSTTDVRTNSFIGIRFCACAMSADLPLDRRASAIAFTLVELLVVVAVAAILAAILLPALNGAKRKAQMINCISNLHQVGIGLALYVDDHRQTFPPCWSEQFDPAMRPDQDYGDFLGGIDAYHYYFSIPAASNRLLARYVSAPKAFRCPLDPGFGPQAPASNLILESLGCSYRFNSILPNLYQDAGLDRYNLSLKRVSWAPEPSRFISMSEKAVYPLSLDEIPSTASVTQWHGGVNPGVQFRLAVTPLADRDQLVAPALFVDGHSRRCDFTATFKRNWMRGLEPTKDWMWYKPVQ